jgi:hypothetical protein
VQDDDIRKLTKVSDKITTSKRTYSENRISCKSNAFFRGSAGR